MRLFSPYCMRGLLLYFEGNKTVEEAYLYAAFIVCIPLSNLFTRHNLHYLLMTLGMHLRVSVTALMYKKVFFLAVSPKIKSNLMKNKMYHETHKSYFGFIFYSSYLFS